MNSNTASEKEVGEALKDVLGVLKKELYFQKLLNSVMHSTSIESSNGFHKDY